MNFPKIITRGADSIDRGGAVPALATGVSYEDHLEESKRAQKKADRWLMTGAFCMGTLVLGVIGFPIFFYGLSMMRKAGRAGLSVRPLMVTLIGYLVFGRRVGAA